MTPSSRGTTTGFIAPRRSWRYSSLVERTGVRVAVVTGGDYDLTTADGRLAARIVGAMARKESEDRSRRVRPKHLELAEQGRRAGRLGWGVRSEEERALVRVAAGRVLAGHGLMAIARDWNQRGVPGATEHRWTAKTLRKVLLSARVAGLREHGVDRSGRVLGALSAAVWEEAIDRKTWNHVRFVLLNPERLTTAGTPTRYLLTGLIFCGVCGGRMLSRPRDDHTKRYVCAGRRPGHQLAILAQPVDDLVAARVLALLTTPAFREVLLAQTGRIEHRALGRALAGLGAAQTRVQTLDDDYYVRGVLGLRRYRSIRTRLEREVERLHARVDAASKQRIILHPNPRQLAGRDSCGPAGRWRRPRSRPRGEPGRRECEWSGVRIRPARPKCGVGLAQARQSRS